MKPHAWTLWLVVALLGTVGALIVSRGWAEETHKVKKETGQVSNEEPKKYLIDHPDKAEPVSPQSVTTVGTTITIVSKTFKPPGPAAPPEWCFKDFATPIPWKYVDIETDPASLPATANPDEPTEIKITLPEVPETAAMYPLKGEGNLKDLRPKGSGGGGGKDVGFWTAMISKVKIYWETYDQPGDNIPIDAHPAVPANGGQRIFPGKKEYNDTAENAAKRRYVFAVVEFAAGAALPDKMYYRLWDVDDPSSDTAPIDENGTVGGDNRGKDVGEQRNGWHVADEDGKHISAVTMGHIMRFVNDTGTQGEESNTCAGYIVKCTVRVGMQPGDNWRFAVAWGDGAKARLEAMTQAQADACQPPVGVVESEMLTTWRKVHVEVDAMQADTNNTNMLPPEPTTIDAATYNAGTGRTDLEVDDVPGFWPWNDWDVDDAFNGGWIKVQNEATSPWGVVDFDANTNDDDVFVAGNHTSANGKTYLLGDDDYDNVGGNLTLKVSHPRDPETEWLESRLAKAYVEPKLYRDTTDSNRTFDRNLSVSYALMTYLLTDFDFYGQDSPAFWVSLLVSAHQPQADVDNDPDSESGVPGATYRPCSAVFLETTRDVFVEEQQDEGADERAFVVHEIGHTVGAFDITTGRDTAGVMYYGVPVADTWFNGKSLDEIRDYTHE